MDIPHDSKLLDLLHDFMEIVADSDGVSGYHRNGDIALWSEFPVIEVLKSEIEKAKVTSVSMV